MTLTRNLTQQLFGLQSCIGLTVLVCLFALTGCDGSPPARFHLNMVAQSKERVDEANQQQVADILTAMFGTPDNPFVLPETGLDINKLRRAAGPVSSDKIGQRTGLYREHCVHCHGISGDGMGPTAAFLKPYPRDFRQGVFKFKSNALNAMPTDEDLMRTLKHGLENSAMPSFEVALPPADLEALAEYVKYLSMRGQTELALIAQVFETVDDDDKDKRLLSSSREMLLDTVLLPIAEQWQNANDSVVRPEEPPADFGSLASIEKGRQLFFGNKGGCVKCHGTTALGDGQTTDFDAWSKLVIDAKAAAEGTIEKQPGAREALSKKIAEFEARKNKVGKAEPFASPEAEQEAKDSIAEDEKTYVENEFFSHMQLRAIDEFSLPPRNIEPRNLRMGYYRGGRRPIDIYYRLATGIYGTPMPGIAGPAVTTEEIWNIVDYVLAVPLEPGGQLGADRTMAARERN